MRRRWFVSICVLLAWAGTTVIAVASPGRTTADDVLLEVGLDHSLSPNSTASLGFKIHALVSSGSGVEQDFTLRIGLPDGLRWGTDGPDPGEGCEGTAPAICTQRLLRNPVGTVEGGWVWDVVAERVGLYEITATVEPREPDPDLSNNTATFRFEVKQPASGGAGGGAASNAVASAVKLSPAKPRAGSTVTATVRVTAEGVAIRPTRVSCVATVGRTKSAGLARAQVGAAVCRYRTLATAKGKTMRGAVAFTVQRTRITRRFSIRLG